MKKGKQNYVSLNILGQYPVIGKGVFGTVYRLTERTCLKVNRCPANNLREVELYKKYGDSTLFPKILGTGKNYILMEYIAGISLREYLERGNDLNDVVMAELVKMFKEGQRIGLSLNPNARHVILTPAYGIKLIDIEDIVKFASVTPYMLLNRINRFGKRKKFLNYVKSNNMKLFKEWGRKINRCRE